MKLEQKSSCSFVLLPKKIATVDPVSTRFSISNAIYNLDQ